MVDELQQRRVARVVQAMSTAELRGWSRALLGRHSAWLAVVVDEMAGREAF